MSDWVNRLAPLSCRPLVPLTLILTAGCLTLNLPGSLLICAVADCALINLYLSARRYHRCIRVAVWTCSAWRKRMRKDAAELQKLPLQSQNWILNCPYVTQMCFLCALPSGGCSDHQSHQSAHTMKTSQSATFSTFRYQKGTAQNHAKGLSWDAVAIPD